jgi:hypothetical protein
VTTTSPGVTAVRPEVAAFVLRVREHLADLTEEEREELLDGLEADLSEQLAAGDELPDPSAYAVELRAAAGLPATRRHALPFLARPGRPPRLTDWPDLARAEWFALTERSGATRQVWTLLEAVGPAWWVLRAWLAVTLLDQLAGPWEYVSLWPTLGPSLVGPLVLLGAVVVSVLIGQGKLWPGSGPDRTTLARMVLIGLNAFAVVVPLTFTGDGSQWTPYVSGDGYHAGFRDANQRAGLRIGTDVVRNIYAYDAQGQPLQGIQLFDQRGRPVAVSAESSMGDGADRQVTCPWFNGTTALFNVFPLPQRTQRHGTCLGRADPAKVGQQGFHQAPLASVPPATVPVVPQG